MEEDTTIPAELLEKCYEYSGSSKIKGVIIATIDDECSPRVWTKTTSLGINILLEAVLQEYIEACYTTRKNQMVSTSDGEQL